jgi:ribonuclease Z
VPGVVQRLSLDRAPQPVTAHYPASGAEFFHRLRYAAAFHEVATLHEAPVERDGTIATGPFGTLEARRLDHRIDTFGYRLVEPDGRRMLAAELSRLAIDGPDVGRLQREGVLDHRGRRVTVEQVSEPRPGQRFAFVMDTRLCDGVYALADGADMLVIESTFRHADAALAGEYGHLTTTQAATVAAECGVRLLVLAHFSGRYPDSAGFHDEAAEVFDGDIVVAEDLARVPMPKRVAR